MALLFYWAANISYGQSDVGLTLDQVVALLGKTNGVGIVGWEAVPDSRENIIHSNTLREAILQLDIVKVVNAIVLETDYECLVGSGYIIIYPKKNPSIHDSPLSMRKVTFPDATKLPYNQFLAHIKTDGPLNGIYLNDSAPYRGQISDGLISIRGGQNECYKVLNQMAKQLNTNVWIMGHMVLPDAKTNKPQLPMKLNIGFVSFFNMIRD